MRLLKCGKVNIGCFPMFFFFFISTFQVHILVKVEKLTPSFDSFKWIPTRESMEELNDNSLLVESVPRKEIKKKKNTDAPWRKKQFLPLPKKKEDISDLKKCSRWKEQGFTRVNLYFVNSHDQIQEDPSCSLQNIFLLLLLFCVVKKNEETFDCL